MGKCNRSAAGVLTVTALVAGLAAGVPATASAAVTADSALVINEVYGGGGNSGAQYTNDFVELYNKGTDPVDLSAYAVQYASAGGGDYKVTTLNGTVPGGQHYLVQEAKGNGGTTPLPTPNATGTIAMSGSNGKVALTSSATALSGTANPATDPAVVDYVGYGSATVFAGTGPAPVLSNTTSNSRTGFRNTADNKSDFTVGAPSPTAGTLDTTPPGGGDGGSDAGSQTIAAIQGTTDTSPFASQTVTTEGVVTAAYPAGANSLNGFTIQTAGTGGAKDTSTASDGLFVFAPGGFDVVVGDSVSVTGTVSEYFGLTELSPGAAGITKLGTALAPATPVTTTAWPATDALRESLESMLYAPGAFTVTDTFSGLFNSSGSGFGEVGLAAGDEPLIQPTDVADAQDSEAIATVKADNATRAVILDDGSAQKFGPTVGDTTPYLSQTDPVRVGAAVEFPAPVVVSYGNGTFKLEPTSVVTATTPEKARPSFAATREAAPKPVGGDLSLSSFNVLNYFTTLGTDRPDCSAFTDRDGNPVAVNRCTKPNGPRGAWDAEDLARQQIKIVKAINANDASVTGLMEIENSAVLGDPTDTAVTTLVAALNADAGSAKWASVPSSTELPPTSEMDVINNAIIYQPAKVTRLGESHALGTLSGAGEAFDNAREPIAQAFTPTGGGTPFLAVVNHFKSKGSGSDDGTGQGNANPDRIAQADALRDWVPGIEAGYATPVTDTFLLGDFNSYTMEDPLQALYTAGYANLAQESDYSYSFSGLSGSLDHVLANASAKARVTGSDVWNINSPESVALEYSRFNYLSTSFFAPDPFAASDHDPVKVGFTAGATTGPPTGDVTLNLLDINDFHGRIDSNTVKFAGTVEGLRAAGGEANTLFVSAGDNIGASLYPSSSAVNPDGTPNPDRPTLDVLNAMGLDASAIGNHELDRGAADLQGRVGREAAFPYLSANIYAQGTTNPVFPTYATFTKGGLTVAVIGAITQETKSLVSPAGTAGLEFGDPTDAVNRVADQLTDGDLSNGEADVIIESIHEGASEGTPEGATLEKEIAEGGAFAKIATQTSPKVAAIFTGHTHKEYVFDAPIVGTDRTRPIIQTGSYGANVGQVELTVDRSSKTVVSYAARNVKRVATPDAELVAQYPRVATVKQITDAALAAARVTGAVPVGSISADITRAFGNGAYTDGTYTVPAGTPPAEDRSEESTDGHLVANAVRDASIPSGETPDIGITNPGGLRSDLLFAGSTGADADTNGDGVVTTAEAVAVQPFANSLFLLTLTGDQLKTVLEQQDQPTGSSRPYLALGLSDNVTYTYDRTQAVGSGITSIAVNGKAVQPGDSFRVATNSFLAAGGDNFTELARGTNQKDTGLIDLDVFTDAIKNGSPVAPSFAKSGVSVTGLDTAEKAPKAGSTITFDVSDLGLTSLGSPEVTSVRAAIGSAVLGSFPVTPSTGTPGSGNTQTGTAAVSVTIPSGLSGAQVLTLSAAGGTTVSIPLTVAPAPSAKADLALSTSSVKTGRGTATVTFTLTNNGPGTAAASTVQADAYGSLRVTGGGGDVKASVQGNTVSFAAPGLERGQSVRVTVEVAKRGFLGLGFVTARITASGPDPVPWNNATLAFVFTV
ncbi:MAG: ExeM/NucH family extracellular endonuclease [Mycobacteriaceae bacterium]